jgi:hypothetical protein
VEGEVEDVGVGEEGVTVTVDSDHDVGEITEKLREIIDACRGEQAREELRKNAKEVQRKFEKAWEEGGEAKRELNALLELYRV